MTTPVPSSSDRGRFRFGFRVSAAVKVTFSQAKAAKSGPTMAVAIRTQVPGPASRFLANPVKFAPMASGWRPKPSPQKTSPATAAILAAVKASWTRAPKRTPRMFTHVSRAMDTMARRFSELSPIVYGPIVPARRIQFEEATHGKNTPVNLAKAMATAAIVAEPVTRKVPQP